MNNLQRLVAIEELKQLKVRYFHCLDLKDWGGLHQVFSEDALFDVRGALEAPKEGVAFDEEPIRGLNAIVDYIRQGLQSLVSVHYGHMPRIELLDADHASGAWAMEDWLYGPHGTFHGQGHYHETYIRQLQGWRIQSLRLTRLHVKTMSQGCSA